MEHDDKKIEISLIQKLFLAGKITTEYRDKMLLERNNILLNFATKTRDNGPLYFVYAVSKSNKFILCCYSMGSSKSMFVERSQVPQFTRIDCVLRISEGVYVLDEETTEDVSFEINKMIHALLNEQLLTFEEKRIDGAFYDVIEVYQNGVLISNQNNGDCFEEICVAKDVLEKLTTGDILQYLDGNYVVV